MVNVSLLRGKFKYDSFETKNKKMQKKSDEERYFFTILYTVLYLTFLSILYHT